jgi:steroid 5-alpha reductase family enzyme
MPPLNALGISALVLFALLTLLWLVSLRLKNSSIVDIFWGSGFVVTNLVYAALTPDGLPYRKWLITVLVTVWGLRLSLYILRRNWGKPEDFRYQAMRQAAGGRWWWQSLFQVFLLQGVLLWIIAMPLWAAQSGAGSALAIVADAAGCAVWVLGFFFESVGDWQLARFRADSANKGKVMQTGVWRYTRHPNYFGDSAQWWGFYLIALAAGGWWTVFSPILMTLLLVRVSGVALLEKTMSVRPGYREYIERTSAFFPWFPRKP